MKSQYLKSIAADYRLLLGAHTDYGTNPFTDRNLDRQFSQWLSDLVVNGEDNDRANKDFVHRATTRFPNHWVNSCNVAQSKHFVKRSVKELWKKGTSDFGERNPSIEVNQNFYQCHGEVSYSYKFSTDQNFRME